MVIPLRLSMLQKSHAQRSVDSQGPWRREKQQAVSVGLPTDVSMYTSKRIGTKRVIALAIAACAFIQFLSACHLEVCQQRHGCHHEPASTASPLQGMLRRSHFALRSCLGLAPSSVPVAAGLAAAMP